MRKLNRIKVVAGATFIAVLGITSLAHAGHLGNGAQQRIQAAANTCLKMPHDKMVADHPRQSQDASRDRFASRLRMTGATT